MTSAYLTEIEITRALRLPDKVGRVKMAMWKKEPSFPAPEPGTAGRRFFPSVEEWLRRHHHLDEIPISEIKAARGKENFDEWRAQRAKLKARKAARPRRPGLEVSPPQVAVADNVVATIGPGGKRIPRDGLSPVANESDTSSSA